MLLSDQLFIICAQEELLHFQESFFKYDRDFEYGAELPELFLRYRNNMCTCQPLN